MPLIDSTFLPACGLGSGHLQTIWPALFRRLPQITRHRERLELNDGDFLDLDWAAQKRQEKLVILTHGLEGSSADDIIQGMAAVFYRKGWSVLAWNMRGCSGEPNRLPRFYHAGATEDLQAVLDHVVRNTSYDRIGLIGFSLGGNLVLKYAGDLAARIDPRIVGVVAFSTPCDLRSSVVELDRPPNRLYMRRFLRKLRAKILEKKQRFPDALDVDGLSAMRNFHEFDNAYTAPLHGFATAEIYWREASCGNVLDRIQVPALLVNARNDPFLGDRCYPSQANNFLTVETPQSGGHCGFLDRHWNYWAETRAVEFLEQLDGNFLDNL